MVDVRPVLWAHSLRNTLGRTFGASWAYTPIQIGVATVIFDMMMDVAGNTDIDAVAWVSDVDRECSFLLRAVGDHGQAMGACQWHQERRDIIKLHTGVDVSKAYAGDQCKAIIWETSQAPSAYRTVQPRVQSATTLEAKIRAIVHYYEGSGNQDRDVARQLAMANHWLTYFRERKAAK